MVASHLGAHPGAWGEAGRWGRSQWEGGGRVGSQGEVLRTVGHCKAWICSCSGDDCGVAGPSDPTPAFVHWYWKRAAFHLSFVLT